MKLRSVLVSAALACSAFPVVAVAAPAHAADWAPYAQAAAIVNADGSTEKTKNVAEVTNPQTGFYCLTVADGIDVTESIINVSKRTYDRAERITTTPSSTCGNKSNTVMVRFDFTGDQRPRATSFYFSIS